MNKLNSIERKVATIDLRRGCPVAEKRITGRPLTRIRDRIIARDGAACRKCGKMVGRLEVDHIFPIALGGQETDENRQLLCAVPCHRDKSLEEEKARR
jgi:5-methylcytosine-specific restriction endonuclease McrA